MTTQVHHELMEKLIATLKEKPWEQQKNEEHFILKLPHGSVFVNNRSISIRDKLGQTLWTTGDDLYVNRLSCGLRMHFRATKESFSEKASKELVKSMLDNLSAPYAKLEPPPSQAFPPEAWATTYGKMPDLCIYCEKPVEFSAKVTNTYLDHNLWDRLWAWLKGSSLPEVTHNGRKVVAHWHCWRNRGFPAILE